jgi:hypothetical protein
LAKGVKHSNPIKAALVTTFNVTCNCKLMRAVKEENSPNYNLKQLEGTSVGDLKAERVYIDNIRVYIDNIRVYNIIRVYYRANDMNGHSYTWNKKEKTFFYR